jgi:L-lactate dehydrogenase complex protein LldG
MPSARDAILGRLRASRASVYLPRADAPTAPPPERRSPSECLLRFHEEATALGIECFVELSAADVCARVRRLTEGLRLLSWDATQLPYRLGDVVRDAAFGHSPRAQQALAEVGLTACDGAIAETGSLVMLSAPGRSRLVSLLPPFHIAVVTPGDLCFSMGEYFNDHRERLESSASCTFITGPSRTADIELTLTLGIHGPGRIAIVLGPDISS